MLIYSCGGGSMRNDNTVLAVELASHGYIVVSAEHADDAAMRMPDGRIVFGTSDADSVPTYKSRRLDLGIVLSELEELNATDEVFGQHLDLDHLSVFGPPPAAFRRRNFARKRTAEAAKAAGS